MIVNRREPKMSLTGTQESLVYIRDPYEQELFGKLEEIRGCSKMLARRGKQKGQDPPVSSGAVGIFTRVKRD